jgi:NAD(P)-dependent dehydrogenase (short-subunit alcohol dehydrogenase family)
MPTLLSYFNYPSNQIWFPVTLPLHSESSISTESKSFMATWDVNGKTCLVTGATNGIGKMTAKALAAQGATVVLVGRNAAKTQEVVEEIRSATNNPKVEFLLADLSSQAEVRRLAQEFKARHDTLHVLVNNAGAMYTERQLTVDGIEMTLALNHLAYFLLTNLLLDTIKASAPARIINVSSDAHTGGKLDWDNLQGERQYNGFGAYSRSKLENILFTFELARRLQGTSVTVNALHPGFVGTGFGSNNKGLAMRLFSFAASIVGLSPEKGAETSIYLATAPELEGVTGKYFNNKKIASAQAIANDADTARKLWEVSAQLVKL